MKLTMQNEKNSLFWELDGSPVDPDKDLDKINDRTAEDIYYCWADVEIPRGVLYGVELRSAKAQMQLTSGSTPLEFSATEKPAKRWKKGKSYLKYKKPPKKKDLNTDLSSPFSAVASAFQGEVKRDTGAGANWEFVPCRRVIVIFAD